MSDKQKLNPPPRYDNVYFEAMSAIEAHDREHGYPQPVLNGGRVELPEPKPIEEDWLQAERFTGNRTSGHAYAVAYWKCRERELIAALAELQSLKSAETAEDAWKRGWIEGVLVGGDILVDNAPPYVAPGASRDK